MRQERKERRREYFFQVQIIISNFSAVYILIISILKNTPNNICGKAYLILIHFSSCYLHGFTIAGTPAIRFTAIFSSIPHIGKLKALICMATPSLGTII